jgi:hypothetical protein
MFDNDLHIPLRFYNAVEKQDRFKPYNKSKRFNQYTDIYHLPEFQVKLAYGIHSFDLKLVDAMTDIVSSFDFSPYYTGSPVNFTIVEYSELQYNQLIYFRTTNFSTILPIGEYYLKLTAGSDYFYSEVFTVTDISDKTILRYYNTNDLAGIDYTNETDTQFQITFIFDATIAKPEYVLEEEAVEDGDGSQMLTWQRSVKEFKMWFYAPEYIADALALVGLHDFVTLTTHYGMPNQETGLIYDFTMVSEWMESKGLSKITCTFRDSPIIKTNCANNLA